MKIKNKIKINRKCDTLSEANNEIRPIGMKNNPTTINVEIT